MLHLIATPPDAPAAATAGAPPAPTARLADMVAPSFLAEIKPTTTDGELSSNADLWADAAVYVHGLRTAYRANGRDILAVWGELLQRGEAARTALRERADAVT